MSSRKVERIKTKNSNDYYATIFTQDAHYKYLVADFNSISIRLVPIDKKIVPETKIKSINLIYINRIISTIDSPTLVRAEESGVIIVDISNSKKVRTERGSARLNINNSFKPFMTAIDPIMIGRVLNFELLNISKNGISLKTSLTNKHITSGQTFEKVELHLPLIGLVRLSFQIKRMFIKDDAFIIGAKFFDISEEDSEKIAKFCLFATKNENEEFDLKKKLLSIKENIFNLKDLGHGITVEIANSQIDYMGALMIRFIAYKKANKLNDTVNNPEDCADIYDKHSIIIVAKIGSTVVGTVRMVFCEDATHTFPFEEYLNTKDDIKSKRTSYYEVSRLAIDPALQRSDIIIKLFKEVARLTIVNHKTTLCFSTRLLRPMYYKIGFSCISEDTPHPTLENETLALLKVESDDFIFGTKMKIQAWEKFSMDVVENLEYGGLLPINIKSTVLSKYKSNAS